ncbi:RtcB family protein [Shouchella clausii]|uniref:3'-phosphate/5'-hydroxy nucleic acid ligase n=1 Tax=Shouchella clausii TaxID=79880 RepID=A0A268P5C2_SHOCL|nr:RtcB family protein [Shouchella clausii]PAE90719.1 RNA-splicing ligase RtcB [Shouchella clausii]
MYKTIDGVRVWGDPLENAVEQAVRCSQHGDVVQTLLMADHHKGYSQPVGGVVVYDGQVSPSGVGYDIACGNKAVRTNVTFEEIRLALPQLLDEIYETLSFGIGQKNKQPVDHELFSDPDWHVFSEIEPGLTDTLQTLARNQLGTIGSGNHFVDLFVEEETGILWVANHFGSRGLGHKTASGFLNLAKNKPFASKVSGESMEDVPTLFDVASELGDMYIRAMKLAGKYAYAGRDHCIAKVLAILQAKETFSVHNHHNFAWKETHNGKDVYVVRKGATPSAPGQLGFIGGSMGDYSVIVEGIDSKENKDAFYSTVHGAGRLMSRTQAAGRFTGKGKNRRRSGGAISSEQMAAALAAFGVELRGGGTDESPFVYKKLDTVLSAHKNTIKIKHRLKPVGVCMAGENEFDPYKD